MSFWEQLKNFFKDKSSGVFTEQNYPGLFGAYNIGHIIILCVAAVAIPLLCVVLRKTQHENIRKYLRIFAIVWIGLEFFKMGRAVYYTGFLSLKNELPLQLCSIYLYALALSAWGKGKVKLAGDNFLASFGIIAGFFGLAFPSIFSLYPIIQFNALHSMLYHSSMIFTGLWMLSAKYVKLYYKNVIYSLVIIYVITVAAIIINEASGTSNYIYLRTAQDTPLQGIGFLPHVLYIFIVLLVVTAGNVIIYLPSFIMESKRKRKKTQIDF